MFAEQGQRTLRAGLLVRVVPIANLLVLLNVSVAHATWPDSGLPIATGPESQTQPVGLTVPGGDLLAFWVDAASGTFSLRAQRVTRQGAFAGGWPAGGRGIVATPALMTRAEIAADGTGGVFAVWYDYRNSGGTRGIYAIRSSAEGIVAPSWSSSGRAICTTFNPEGWGPLDQLIRVCPDGSGGAFVAWTDARNTAPMSVLVYDVFAQHVLGNGTLDPAWPAQGLALTGGGGYKYPHALIADEAGGFWLVTENPLATSQLAVSHHTTSGSTLGTWISPSSASHPDAVSDGAGGVFVTWEDCIGCPEAPDGISAMRLSAGATLPAGWTMNGVRVVASQDDEGVPAITATGDGAAVVAWLASGVGGSARYAAQRVEPNGVLTPTWPAGGRTFSSSLTGLFGQPLIVRDGAGGALLAFRRNLPNLFGSRISMSGLIPPAFPDTGLALCTVTGEQFLSSATFDGVDGAYVLWQDRRDAATNGSDVYVTRFTRDGVVAPTAGVSDPRLGPRLALSAPTPNPASKSCRMRLTLPAATRVRVDVLDLAGRSLATLLDDRVVAGVLDLRWDGRDRAGRELPSGLYLVRARAGSESVVRRIAYLK